MAAVESMHEETPALRLNATVDYETGHVRFGTLEIFDPALALLDAERVVDRLVTRITVALVKRGWTYKPDGTMKPPAPEESD